MIGLITSGNNDTLKSTSWKGLETALSQIKNYSDFIEIYFKSNAIPLLKEGLGKPRLRG